MEQFDTSNGSNMPMACEDCFFYRMTLAEVGEASLKILNECPGSIVGDGFCSTADWQCGHDYVRRPLADMRPVDRVREEIVALSALRNQL